MDEEGLRKGRRIRALARVALEQAELGAMGRELLHEIQGLATELFGAEDPEGVEKETRDRIAGLRRESHQVSF